MKNLFNLMALVVYSAAAATRAGREAVEGKASAIIIDAAKDVANGVADSELMPSILEFGGELAGLFRLDLELSKAGREAKKQFQAIIKERVEGPHAEQMKEVAKAITDAEKAKAAWEKQAKKEMAEFIKEHLEDAEKVDVGLSKKEAAV